MIRRSSEYLTPLAIGLIDLAVRGRGKKWRIALLTLAVFAALC